MPFFAEESAGCSKNKLQMHPHMHARDQKGEGKYRQKNVSLSLLPRKSCFGRGSLHLLVQSDLDKAELSHGLPIKRLVVQKFGNQEQSLLHQ